MTVQWAVFMLSMLEILYSTFFLDYWLDSLRFKSWQGLDVFLFSIPSRLALGPTQHSVEMILGGSFFSPPSDAIVKNEWCCTSTPVVCLCGMCRDNFFFTFWMLHVTIIIILAVHNAVSFNFSPVLSASAFCFLVMHLAQVSGSFIWMPVPNWKIVALVYFPWLFITVYYYEACWNLSGNLLHLWDAYLVTLYLFQCSPILCTVAVEGDSSEHG